jgi:hypothetical protein
MHTEAGGDVDTHTHMRSSSSASRGDVELMGPCRGPTETVLRIIERLGAFNISTREVKELLLFLRSDILDVRTHTHMHTHTHTAHVRVGMAWRPWWRVHMLVSLSLSMLLHVCECVCASMCTCMLPLPWCV